MKQQPTIEQAAAIAWDLIRADSDPTFDGCMKDHQDKLTYHARDVQKTGTANDDFERKVKEVLAKPDEAIAAIKARYALPEPAEIAITPNVEPEPEPAPKKSLLKRGRNK